MAPAPPLPSFTIAATPHFDGDTIPPSSPSPSQVTASQIRVEAGAPQVIRLAGFRDVFQRYYNRVEEAVCNFGPDDQVDCRCDTLQGTMECDVPRVDKTCSTDQADVLTVKAKVADYESPPLVIRYNISPFEDHNVLMRAGGEDVFEGEPDESFQAKVLSFLQRERRRKLDSRSYTLFNQCIAECVGTMFIVVFGVGSVCAAVLTNNNSGLWQIATVWGFGVALAICATASVSGAHLNPAVSLAMAIFRPHDFPWGKLLPYWGAQYLGGVLGGAFNLMMYGPLFEFVEARDGIVRGAPGSLETARAFGEYFPAPDLPVDKDVISPAFAMFVEAWGTGILMFVILALTDPRQKIIAAKEMLPFYIGFTVAVLITLYAPLTQAGWNPARDFGPRVVAALAGWGKIAIPGPRNGFWVYIIGPKIGAPIGALLYDVLINPGLTD